jgi:hypothetical protein
MLVFAAAIEGDGHQGAGSLKEPLDPDWSSPASMEGGSMKRSGLKSADQARQRGTFRFAIVFASLIGWIPAWADEPPKPRLVFADETAATASPDNDGKFAFDFMIKNVGGKAGSGSLTLDRKMGKGCTQDTTLTATPDVSAALQPNAVQVVHVEITKAGLPATCYIELSTKETAGNTSLKQVKLAQQYVTSTFVIPFKYALGVSLAVVFLTALGFRGWGLQFGQPAWEFAKSWASTTTVAGGAFTTAVALGVLPELTKYASKAGYSILALLISLLVVVAPFIFSGPRDGDIVWDEKNHQFVVAYRGNFFFFVLSCGLTLFAALAQLIVVFVVYREMFPDIAPWSYDPPLYIMVALGGVICFYAFLSVKLTVQLQKQESDRAKDEKKKRYELLAKKLSDIAPIDQLANMKLEAIVGKMDEHGLFAAPAEAEKPRPLSWPVL